MLHDPWNLFLAKLASVTKLSKVQQAYQEWFTNPTNTKLIANVVAEWWEKQVMDGMTADALNVGLWTAVARKLSQALDPEVWEEWKKKARDVADQNKNMWTFWRLLCRKILWRDNCKFAVYHSLWTCTHSFWNCINNLPAFAAPLLWGISERTGLAVFMIVRGPMPRNNGQLGILKWVITGCYASCTDLICLIAYRSERTLTLTLWHGHTRMLRSSKNKSKTSSWTSCIPHTLWPTVRIPSYQREDLTPRAGYMDLTMS